MKGNNLKVIGLALCTLFFVQAKAQELLDYPLDTINGEEVYRYEVERSVGLYRIGVNFNVPQSEIIRLNPQLRERGLHYGEVLYLPTGRPVNAKPTKSTLKPKPAIVETEPVVVSTVITETPVVAEAPLTPVAPIVTDTLTITETPDTTDTVLDNRRIVELALMLPFESHQTKRSANAERMLEFYQGALIAMYELQNDSTKYRLRVYDTERSETRVGALCDSTEMDSVRGILGLVYPIQIERVAAWSEVHQVPTLLPFCDNTDLNNRSHLLQFNSTDRQEADSLCRWIKAQDSTIHCAFVEAQESELSGSIRTLRQRMDAHQIVYSNIALQDLLADSVAYALDSVNENLIILHSDRYQNVRTLIPHLLKLQQAGFRIRIVSQYSWQKENILLPQVYTSVFTGDRDREAYEQLWATYFGSEHVSEAPRYDLLGYDLMRCLVAWINGEKAYNGLQSSIYWNQANETSGWQNANVRIVTTNLYYRK